MIGRRLAAVSAGQRDGMGAGEVVEAGKEAGKPGAVFAVRDKIARQSKRKKRRQRLRAHGREITEAAREDAVADGLRRMKVAEEVPAFQRKVSSDEDLIAARGAEDGTVVADAEHEA